MGGTVTNHTFGPQVEAGIRPVRWGFSVGCGLHGRHECSPTVDRDRALRALSLMRVEGLAPALAELGDEIGAWLQTRTLGERLELYEALREQAR